MTAASPLTLMRMLCSAPLWPAIDKAKPLPLLTTLASTPASRKAAAMPSRVLFLLSMVMLLPAPTGVKLFSSALPNSILTVAGAPVPILPALLTSMSLVNNWPCASCLTSTA
ncbi:hypothetical protein [Rugamonas sp. DEMB1]|uniref:hypothetical protein n=1 Tax=Rugamonas sp. DEMB1 TaxID=3039386 RepID=UPI00244C3794|nr:hypothetical protein [Rugamonas sp. DEMB1]WGG48607.1 hypothetical protein QC826_18265 [Rugamonas sp. DEMB1]